LEEAEEEGVAAEGAVAEADGKIPNSKSQKPMALYQAILV
jgi:hypothetical protein